MKSWLFSLVVCSVLLCIHAGSITRHKRGYLSRTGVCPDPASNFQKKDVRLNYMGMAVIRKGDSEDPPCTDSECAEDSHCDGNRKCCKNYCGASVCTVSMRVPHPCINFNCPTGQTCKVQKVKCVMPECPVATAINRPTCIPIEPLEETNTTTLGDFQPDTSEALQQYNAMQNDAAKSDNSYNDAAATAPQNDAASYTAPNVDATTGMQTPDSSLMQAPMVDTAAGGQSNDALSFSDPQQSYATPLDQSSAPSVPTDTASIVQNPMGTSNYAPVPSTDTASFQTPQDAVPFSDQPSQTPAQDPASFADQPSQTPAQDPASFADQPSQTPAQESASFADQPSQTPAQESASFADQPSQTPAQESAPFADQPSQTPAKDSSLISDHPSPDAQVVAQAPASQELAPLESSK